MVKIMPFSGSAVIRMVMVKFWWQALLTAVEADHRSSSSLVVVVVVVREGVRVAVGREVQRQTGACL